MGLRIIYGRAGSGKSQYCFSEISKKINEEEKIIIITPEQFSFTLEKKLMETIQTNAVLNAEVVTLSRMAYRVLQEVGGVNKTNLSKCGKAMLIYSILHSHKKDLKYLGKTDENIDLIMRAITEFKQHNVTLEILQSEIEKIEDAYLKTKLKDIETIYGSFENHIKDNYIDETDKMTILATELKNTDIVTNAVIYIDEFSGFTSQEYEVINQLAKLAKQVNITVCTDSLNQSTNPDTDIFYSNKITIQKLWKLANENDLKFEEPVNLDNTYRFKTLELQHLEKYIFETKSTKYEKNVENISIFLAKNQYSEVEEVAKNISKLVRQNKMRYKEISVITKNIATYSSLIKGIFGKYEIPVFIDEKRELNQNIIVQYVLAILEVLSKNFSNDTMFNYLKLGFANYEPQEIFELENYCLKWGINRNKWFEKFTKEAEERKQEIERLDTIREEIIRPLIKLKKDITKEKTAEGITKALYQFLQEQNIEEKIISKINELQEAGLVDLVQEYKTSYEIVLEVLDQIVLIFGDKKTTIEKYLQILRIGLKNSGLGKIPGTQDQVIIGDVERSRSHKVKAVFIIGLNDGSFPSVNKDEGFLDDSDREFLKEDGIELAKGTLENLYEENFNIYKAFSTAEEKLFLSYSSADAEGATLRPSIYISKIKKMYPKIKINSDIITKQYEINNKASTYEELIENIAELKSQDNMPQVWQAVYEYFANQDEWNLKLEKDLLGLDYDNLPQQIQEEKIEKLYGNVLKTSVSRLERYKSCPFSYFLQYGLKLKEKEELKVHSFDTGSLMHEVIDEFFTEVVLKNKGMSSGEKKEKLKLMTEDEIGKLIDEIVDEKLKLPRNYIFIATAKYKMLVKRLKRIISKALKFIIEGLVNSDFNIENTEVEFAQKGDYKPIIINLEDGKKVEITGKIDRIDTAKTQDGNYLRIIDYKSSVKNVDLNQVYAGLQIQLLTYMDAVCKEEDFLPAGILYFGLIEKLVKANKKISQEEIDELIRKQFKMKGLILADINVIRMQDNTLTAGTSDIIPAGITQKEEISKKTSGINSEEFKILQDYIPVIIKQIANEMLKGNIELKPYRKGNLTPCRYCEYKSICGFDTRLKDNKYNYIDDMEREKVIEKMKADTKRM